MWYVFLASAIAHPSEIEKITNEVKTRVQHETQIAGNKSNFPSVSTMRSGETDIVGLRPKSFTIARNGWVFHSTRRGRLLVRSVRRKYESKRSTTPGYKKQGKFKYIGIIKEI